jgi:hypothetical protein
MFDDEVYAVPDGYSSRPTGKDQELDAKYIELKQHPRVKKLYKRFDPHRNINDVTISEHVHFLNKHDDIGYYLFFGAETSSQFYGFFSPMEHNVRAYTLYKLFTEGKIDIKAFQSATLTSFDIGHGKKVDIPHEGDFVITLKEDGTEVILLIEKRPGGVEWIITYCKHTELIKFNKILEKFSKKYNPYKGRVFDQYGNFIDVPKSTLDDIYLTDYLRKEIQLNVINYVDPKKLRIKQKNNIPTKRGVIFVGKPGTGKTFLSRILAYHLKTTFMVVNSIKDYSQLRLIFDFIKEFDNAILLFEDIDTYSPSRESNSPFLSVMLNNLDGIETNRGLIVICTTNKIEELDEAMKDRPGRFDRVLNFDLPNEKLRIEMFKGFCKGKDITKVDFNKVDEVLPENCSGAHLKEVYITAVNLAIDKKFVKGDEVMLNTDLFLEAIKHLTKEKKGQIGFDGK